MNLLQCDGSRASRRSQRIFFFFVSGYASQCDDVIDTPDTFPSVSWHARIGNQHNSVCRVSWHVIFIFVLPQLYNDDYINGSVKLIIVLSMHVIMYYEITCIYYIYDLLYSHRRCCLNLNNFSFYHINSCLLFINASRLAIPFVLLPYPRVKFLDAPYTSRTL